MFAVVRTGGKQYRVAPGDKIVVERLDGNAGDRVTLGDVLLAGDGGSLKSTDGLTVAAEIVAQAKADKVIVFKKRRRHNYRRKKGHRQQHTLLKIVAIGDHKEQKKPAPSKAEGAAPKAEAAPASAPARPAAAPAKGKVTKSEAVPADDVAGTPTENPAPDDQNAAGAEKPAAKKAAPTKAKPKTGSTENAAPAKAAAKKSPKK
ncbi:MAG: large subunit ribosomal protein [Sphingomonadales bacterium]|nr:large subunit ribosomal protein [Sphingomonadales bacterium]